MLAELERAWRELDADPRRPRHREHRGGRRLPDRSRRAPARHATRTRCASSRAAPSGPSCSSRAWHNGVQKPVIAAVNGVCAGRRAALRGRRRHRDRVVDRHVPRPPRLDRPGHAPTRSIAPGAQVADGADRAHGARRTPRARSPPSGRCQLGILSEVVDPPERLRDAAGELAEKIARNSPGGDGRHQAGAVGRARARASPTPAGPARAELRRHVGPPRPGGGPARLRREARAAVAGDLIAMTDYDDPEGRAPRPGGLADLQPARPAQRHEQPDARRVRRRLDGARRATPRSG